MSGTDSNVQVKFGGSTSDLDAASTRAANDIKKVGTAGTGLSGVFQRLKTSSGSFFSEFKRGWNEADAEIKLKNAKDAAIEFGASSSGAFSGLTPLVTQYGAALGAVALVAAAIAVPVGLISFGAKFGDAAEKLDQMAQKLGMTATEVSQWGSLAVSAGMSTDAFAGSAQKLERTMYAAANGGKAQSAAFKTLGVDINQTKTASATLMAIADKFSTMENGPKKTALAMQLMGRAGATMIPILNQGSEAIRDQFEMADEYGVVVSDSFQTAGLAVDDAMDQMSLGTQGLSNMLFDALAPAIVVSTEAFNDLIKEMIASYRNGGFVKVILEAIAIVCKVVVQALMSVVDGFRILWHFAVAALEGILGSIYSVGSALKKLLEGDFSGIGKSFKEGMRGTGAAMNKEFQSIDAIGAGFRGRTRKLWGKDPLGTGTGKPGGTGDLDDGSGGSGKGKGGGGASKAAADAQRAREAALRAEMDELSFKQEMAREDYAERMRLEDEKLAKLKAFYGADSEEYIRETRNKTRMERDHIQEVIRLEQGKLNALARLEETRASSENEIAQIRLQQERDHFAALDAMGQVSDRQRIEQAQVFADRETDLAVQLENDLFNIKDRALREQLKLAGLPLAEQLRINTELEQMEAEHQGKLAAIRAKSDAETARILDQKALQTQEKWKSIIDPISSAMDGFLSSMVTRSASFGQALVAMGDQLLTALVSAGVKAAANWAVMELTKTSATTAGVAARTTAEAAGAATGTAISAGAAIKQIAHKAAVAAAGAYSAIASIPVVGPFLAPAAAAAALFAVYKIGSSIFSAKDGEGEVPYDGAQYTLHKKEMVLPAKFANPLRSMLTGSGPMASGLAGGASAAGAAARSSNTTNGGDVNFHYGPKHNNTNADLGQLLASDARAMRKWLRNEVRNGSFKQLAGA